MVKEVWGVEALGEATLAPPNMCIEQDIVTVATTVLKLEMVEKKKHIWRAWAGKPIWTEWVENTNSLGENVILYITHIGFYWVKMLGWKIYSHVGICIIQNVLWLSLWKKQNYFRKVSKIHFTSKNKLLSIIRQELLEQLVSTHKEKHQSGNFARYLVQLRAVCNTLLGGGGRTQIILKFCL